MEIKTGQEFRALNLKAVERIAEDPDKALNDRKTRLKKATIEFESYFLLHMLKAMRKTIPESEFLESGPGKDIYTSMFDEELSRKIAGSSSASLSEILYSSLEKYLRATENSEKMGDSNRAGDDVPSSIITPPGQGSEVSRVNNLPEKDVIRPVEAQTVRKETAYNDVRPRIKKDKVLEKFGSTIREVSNQYEVDPRLIYSVIMCESGGRSDAVSSRGAKGLMQLMDGTAREMGVTDSLNPRQNIIGGTKYLRQLLDKYHGNVKLTLAAYNAGPGIVSKYNGVPPYSETRSYIEKVLDLLNSPGKRSGP